MADTAIAITAGSGTNVDTRTEATNGNHRQVIVVGDPSTNAGVAPVDATAGLKVDLGADNDVTVSSISAGDNNIGNVDIVTVPSDPFGANADAASATGSISAKLKFIASTGIPVTGSVAVTNAGTFVVQENGSALTALQLIDDTVFTDDTSTHTPATTKVIGIGMVADEASTDSVNEGDIGMPRMTLDRKVVVTVQPNTANGLSVFNATSSDGATALTNTAQAIKASAGQVYGWYIYNPNATAQFVQFYNTAAGSVTVGTTNPLFMLTIPATAGANVEFTNGITFSNAGFSCAATSTAGGNGAPTTALDAVIFYN